TEGGVELFGEFPALKGKSQELKVAQFFRLWLFFWRKLHIKNALIKPSTLLVFGLPPSAGFAVFAIGAEKMWLLPSLVTHSVKRNVDGGELRGQFPFSLLLSGELVEGS